MKIPTLPPQASKFKDEDVVISWQGFCVQIPDGTPNGHPETVRAGTRLRASNLLVKAAPQNFVLDGTPIDEMPSVFAAASEEHARLIANGQSDEGVARILDQPVIPLEEQMFLVEGFVGVDIGGKTYRPGVPYRRTDPGVARNLRRAAEHQEDLFFRPARMG